MERKREEMEVETEGPEAAPEITPQMIKRAFETLEAKGLVYEMGGKAYVPTAKGWKLLRKVRPGKEEIIAYGHPNITAKHKSTFEITKGKKMKEDADCIIAVRADKACEDLKDEFKNGLKNGGEIEITIEAGGEKDKIVAYGSPALELTNSEDIVVRKGDFIDNRTLAILADKAACDLKKSLIKKLKDSNTVVKITLEIKMEGSFQ